MKTSRSILFFYLVLVLTVYNWLDNSVLLPNHVKTVLLGHFLIHSLACYFSFGLLKFQKFPFVLLISAVNLITFFYAPSILDPIDFQLGTLNYPILNDLFLGYLIFYTTYFFLLHRSLSLTNSFITRNIKIVYRLDALKRLKKVFLTLFVLQLITDLPVNGLNEFIILFTIGLYCIGFLTNQNTRSENIIFFSLLVYQSIRVVTSGLIYNIIYFGMFLIVIFKNYGLQSKRGIVLMSTLLGFYLIFSILFSTVKMEYRATEFTTNSVFEKITVIYNLLSENNNFVSVASVQDQSKHGPIWRLSYPLSAISLVKEKTPYIIPYWNGESYLPIFTKFIPRFFWPDKPKENMGQEFGHRYGILAWDNLTTSMNTPIVAEAYMNFGMIGFYFVFFFMAIVIASTYNAINSTSTSDPISVDTIVNTIVIAIAAVYFTQWESNLTMMIGKFIILYITTYVIRKFVIQA